MLKTPFPLFLFLIPIILCSCAYKFEKIEPIQHPYLLSFEIEHYIISSEEPQRFQVGAGKYSQIGNYSKMLSTLATHGSETPSKTQSEMEDFHINYKSEPALTYVKSKIQNEQIVIINEAHHQSAHRIFTLSLLEELYREGFRYFGVETLSELDLSLNQRKYPFTDSGYYTNDPQFGELTREALRLGFHLFPYDSMDKGGADREAQQARNIKAMIDKDPTGKFLIHCGFMHAAEGNLPSWGKAMAGRIFELSGINPLTINQSDYTEYSKRQFEDPLFQNLDPEFPTVYFNANYESYKFEEFPEHYDIMIFQERTKMNNGRPSWLFHPGKNAVEITFPKLDIQLPALVMAFYENEDFTKAVPADIQELDDLKDTIYLALKPGKYNIVIQNANAEARKRKLKVK